MVAKKYYAVLVGKKTGIFDSWKDCDQQIRGFSGAIYKVFKTRREAEAALSIAKQSPSPTQEKAAAGRGSKRSVVSADEIVLDSICVEAFCSGNPGDVEYQGVCTRTRKTIFHKQPMPNGTNNLGEFLALVHAIAHLKKQNSSLPIYTNSETAIRWVNNKQVTTSLQPNEHNQEIFGLVKRAIAWLKTNEYSNKIWKWNTLAWGEIPASFGRKQTKQLPEASLNKTAIVTLEKAADDVIATISGNTYPYRKLMKKIGFTWRSGTWTGHIPKAKVDAFRKLCRRYDLTYTLEGAGIKESKLARGGRPIQSVHSSAVMGESYMQWEISEMLKIERQRSKQQKKRQQ